MADRYFDEMREAPGSGGWQAIKGTYHWLRSQPHLFGETDAWTGVAPIDGIPGGSISKASRLAAQAAKEDKALGVSSKVKNMVKYGRGFDSGDARHINSGFTRVTRQQRALARQQIADRSYSGVYGSRWDKLQLKKAKASNPEVQKRLQSEENALLQEFIKNFGLH